MSTTAVLRGCEATTYDVGMNPIPCGEPGLWRELPNGKAYVLCDHHRRLFA